MLGILGPLPLDTDEGLPFFSRALNNIDDGWSISY